GDDELRTDQWLSVLEQARELGVLQVHMSGGEPLARHDVVDLVGRASDLGCYVNLVTSGLGLTERKLAKLVDAGLAHVQLSVQGADATLADRIAGTPSHSRKLAAAALVHRFDLPLTVNVVLHKANHHQVGALIELAEQLEADRLELANIWDVSSRFNAFRGESWMRSPCGDCPRRTLDFGGCRCQAFLLTGDANATDPVCSLSPGRPIVDAILAGTAPPEPFVMRPNP